MNSVISSKYALQDDEIALVFKEAQKYLRVSSSTIYRLLESGDLKGYKVGKAWRFFPSDLRAAMLPAIRAVKDVDTT